MYRSALISQCERHRYALERKWGPGKLVVFVMLNPSKADALIDDPTVKKCMRFAKDWGFDGIRIVNLCSWRATKPADMYFFVRSFWTWEQQAKDIAHAKVACTRADVGKIVFAWGKIKPELQEQAEMIYRAVRSQRKIYALSVNLDGSPAHPLYQPGNTQPQLYKMNRRQG